MSNQVRQLVILGSTVTALALVRNSHQLGVPCTVIDNRSGPAFLTTLAKLIKLETHDDEEILSTLLNQARLRESALIVDSDRWLRWLVHHRTALQADFAMILHPPNAVLNTCLNKSTFVRWCHDNKIPAPKLYKDIGADTVETAEFPVLVRPDVTRHGMSSDLPKALEVPDKEQLRDLLRRYAELGAQPNVCQSLLRPNVRQYSVGVVRREASAMRVIVAEKVRPTPRTCGGGTFVVAKFNDEVSNLAGKVADKLGLIGPAEVEIFHDEDSGELFVLEVNPRPWVQYALAVKSGFDFLAFLLRPESYNFGAEMRRNASWIHFGDDLYVVFSRSEGMLANDEISLTKYFKTMLSANVFALWALRDPKPFVLNASRRILGRSQQG